MKTKLITLLSLLLVVAACPLRAGNVIVEHYAEKDGLPSNSVNCALKGSEGFLWFGTWYGLSRYDGTRFRNYANVGGQGVNTPAQKIETIAEDSNGNLWLKTSDWKLFVFIKKREEFHVLADDIKPYTRNIQVIKIQPCDGGNVLLLTKSKDLLLANTDRKGGVHVTRLINSQGYVDRDYRLKQNIVGENEQYVYWQDAGYGIACVRKGVSRMLIPKTRYASFHVVKGMIYLVRPDGTIITVDTKRGLTDIYDGAFPFRNSSPQCATLVDSKDRAWTLRNTEIEMQSLKNGSPEMFSLPFFGRVCDPKIVEVQDKFVMFLSANGDVYLYDNATHSLTNIKALPQFRNRISTTSFYDIYCDRQGVVWLSSTQDGVFKMYFPESLFRMIKLPGMDAPNGVRALHQMKNGDVLVGLRDKDLLLLDRWGNVKRAYPYSTFGIGSVYYMMPDRSGNIWLSTKGNGLAVMSPDHNAPDGFSITHYMPDANDKWSISGRNVYMTYQDTRGHIWVCTFDGGLNLVVFDNGKVRFSNKNNAFRNYPRYGQYMEVRSIVEDDNDRLWVGTIDGLMSLDARFTDYRNIRFETYHSNEVSSFATSDVYSLVKPHKGNIWISSFGCGVGRITSYNDSKHIPAIEPVNSDGFAQNSVAISMTEDLYHRMWLCFEKNITCYDGRIAQVRQFGAADGLPDVDFEENATLANVSGEMWFGCKQGILAYKGRPRKSKTVTYPTRIVGLTIDGQDYRSFTDKPVVNGSLTDAKAITLSHSQNTFTLQFAALTYINQGSLTYRYRMEGLDGEWHNAGAAHEAAFTDLAPGSYVFTVEAVNSDNPDIKSSCTLYIKILTPLWARWWAVLVYVCMAAFAGWYVWRLIRRRRTEEQKAAYDVQTPQADDYMRLLEDKDRQFVQNVNDIIDANIYNADFSIDTVAQALGISRSAFFKRLKSVTGHAPVDYIKEYRLSKSVTLMRTTDLSVTEIAFQVGFKDAGYFGKCFRKRYGKTPREFMSEIRKQEKGT